MIRSAVVILSEVMVTVACLRDSVKVRSVPKCALTSLLLLLVCDVLGSLPDSIDGS